MRKAVFGFAVAVVFTLAGVARAQGPWAPPFHNFQPHSLVVTRSVYAGTAEYRYR